jgi:hypothetical protein
MIDIVAYAEAMLAVARAQAKGKKRNAKKRRNKGAKKNAGIFNSMSVAD